MCCHLFLPQSSLNLKLIGRSDVSFAWTGRANGLRFLLWSNLELHLKIGMITKAITKSNSRVSSWKDKKLIVCQNSCWTCHRVDDWGEEDPRKYLGKIRQGAKQEFRVMLWAVLLFLVLLCQFNPHAKATHSIQPFNHHLSYILCFTCIKHKCRESER